MVRLAQLVAATSTRRQLVQASGGCHNCPHGSRKDKAFVPATMTDAPFILVGEAPGKTEVQTREGFTGESGRLLREVLARHGLDRYALTNTVHCRPPDNAEPSPREVERCMNAYTIKEATSYPLAVLVGSVPMRAFFPKTRASKLRGNVAWHPDFPGHRFYSMYHPAYVLRNPDARPSFERQVGRIADILRETGPKFNIIRGDGDAVLAATRRHMETGFLACDLENGGPNGEATLKPYVPGGYIRAAALTSNTHEAVFVHHEEPWWDEYLDLIAQYIATPGVQFLNHHVGFDIGWIEHVKKVRARCRPLDTAFLYYQLRYHQQPSLKFLAGEYGDGYRYLIHDPSREPDLNLLANYAAEDVIHTVDVWRKGIAQLTPRSRDLVLRMSGPTDVLAMRYENRGVHFRVERWEGIKNEVEAEQAAIIAKWRAADPRFNPDEHLSGKGEERYLFDIVGVPVLKTTESGKRVTDASAVKEWVRQGFTILQHMLDWRKLEKRRTTYVEPFEGLIMPDGRIHPSFKTTRTDTGRSSSADPNYQNQERGKVVRGNFGARDKYVFAEADASQIELRLAMCLAGDPVGIAAYQRGDDLHTTTAARFAPGGVPTKEHRTHAKPVNFALIYGGDSYGLRRYARDTYGIEFTQAQSDEYVRGFFELYRMLRPWHERERANLIANRGHAESVIGHRFHYKKWDDPDEGTRDHIHRSHLNSKCQGPASYMNRYTAWQAELIIAEHNLDMRIIPFAEVHDAIHAEVRAGAEQEWMEVIQQSVRRTKAWVSSWMVVPLVYNFGFGPSWGETEEVEFEAAA